MHIASTALVAFFLASGLVSAHSVASRDPSVVVETVFVSAPESEAHAPAPPPHKSHYHKSHHHKFHQLAHKHKQHHDATPAPSTPQPAPFKLPPAPTLPDSIPAKVPVPAPTPKPAPSPTESQPPVPAPAPEPASTSSATPPSSTSTSLHPKFHVAGWPSYMDTVNYYRDHMGLPKMEWSPKLDAGAQRVCQTCNGQQVHNDGHDGWRGQVLCPAGQDDFDNVYLYGWLCERPNVGSLVDLCPNGANLFLHNGETGHYDIVANPKFTQIGCAWYKGIWCCDLC